MNKFSLLLVGALVVASRSFVQAQSLTFDRALTCASGDGPDGWGPTAQAFDTQGNLYVAGSFNGTITLGNTTLTATQVPPNRLGSADNFVAKLNAAGNYVWAMQFGDNQVSFVSDLAVDAAGHVYLAGSFDSYSLRLGGPAPVLFNSSASSEAFVAQLSAATGQLQWARRAGGTGFDYAAKLAFNAAGEVYVACQVSSATADFGATTLTSSYTGSIGAAFLAKLSATGAWQWARPVGSGAGLVTDLELDVQGGIYLAGSFRNSLDFGTVLLTSQRMAGTPSLYGADVFVAKTTDAGGWNWAVQGDAVTHQNFIDGGVDMALDGTGHLYIVGSYANASVRLGNSVLPNLSNHIPPNSTGTLYPNNYYTDAFAARLNTGTGAWEWATRYGGLYGDGANSPLLDAQGRLYAGYGSNTSVTGGGGWQLARIDPANGAWLATQPMPVFGYMLLDGQNRLNLTGSIGTTPTTFGTITLQPAGPNRGTGYLARLATLPLATRPAQQAPALTLWPNPAGGGAVWVQGPAAGQAVQVLDVLGRAVATGRMPATGPLHLPLALPTGVYVVRAAGQARRLVVE